jgi:hypothetical protein
LAFKRDVDETLLLFGTLKGKEVIVASLNKDFDVLLGDILPEYFLSKKNLELSDMQEAVHEVEQRDAKEYIGVLFKIIFMLYIIPKYMIYSQIIIILTLIIIINIIIIIIIAIIILILIIAFILVITIIILLLF